MTESNHLLVICTCPSHEEAKKLSRLIISGHLAACVNLIHGVTSIYSWNETIAEDNEIILLIKTTRDSYSALEQAILNHHPYELPEIIAVDINDGNSNYLKWISECVKPLD
ncbi:MAG: divalent-cation tolerance protein CutA [Gammaproteobacteria bacterium]|nr:divalent-cation tolerance protein CutA [Gammaproteobacteria bacterium]